MTQKEFLKRSKWQIVKCNVIYNFKRYSKYDWLIAISVPGAIYVSNPKISHWHTATTIVLDTEAYAIYENLLNDQGEA